MKIRVRSATRAVVPFVVLTIAGLLTFLLVSRIVTFSERVTSVYTPGIIVFENLLEGAEHLRKSVMEHGRVGSDDVAYGHFVSALNQAERMYAAKGSGQDAGVHEDVFSRAASIRRDVQNGVLLDDPEALAPILEGAAKLAQEHRQALMAAKSKIRAFAIMTGLLCFVVLAVGTFYGLREYRLAEVEKHEAATLSALVALVYALDARDPYTKGHSERVASFSRAIGAQLGLSARRLRDLHLAALLHDIGKIGIPDNILKKEGRLTDEEYSVMKRHPEIGAEILEASIPGRNILPGLRHHHERWDGRGYPDGLQGDGIPLEAQIIAMADSYDAMASSRPYRKGLSREDVLGEIKRCSGQQWSGEIVDVFLSLADSGGLGEGLGE